MATVPYSEKITQEEPQALSGLPDLAYIRQYVSIEEVAEFLGFDVRAHQRRCFRPDNHQNGDRTPSFQFFKNNRAKCFCCDRYAFSNIDFVQMVLGCDTFKAIRWICMRFPNLPAVRVGRPRGSRSRERHVHVGVYGGQLENVVRSGFFAKLSAPAARLLTVLVAVQDERGQVNFSYAALLHLTGLGSTASLTKGLAELAHCHAINVRKVPRSDGPGWRNVYKLTLEDPKLLADIEAARRDHWHDVEQDREARAASKRLRSHGPKTPLA